VVEGKPGLDRVEVCLYQREGAAFLRKLGGRKEKPKRVGIRLDARGRSFVAQRANYLPSGGP